MIPSGSSPSPRPGGTGCGAPIEGMGYVIPSGRRPAPAPGGTASPSVERWRSPALPGNETWYPARGSGVRNPDRVAACGPPGNEMRNPDRVAARTPSGGAVWGGPIGRVSPAARPGINARAPETKPTEGAEWVFVRRITEPFACHAEPLRSISRGVPSARRSGNGEAIPRCGSDRRERWLGTNKQPRPVEPLQWASFTEPGHLSPGGVRAATRSGSHNPFPGRGRGGNPVGVPHFVSGRAAGGNRSGSHNPLPRAGRGRHPRSRSHGSFPRSRWTERTSTGMRCRSPGGHRASLSPPDQAHGRMPVTQEIAGYRINRHSWPGGEHRTRSAELRRSPSSTHQHRA